MVFSEIWRDRITFVNDVAERSGFLAGTLIECVLNP